MPPYRSTDSFADRFRSLIDTFVLKLTRYTCVACLDMFSNLEDNTLKVSTPRRCVDIWSCRYMLLTVALARSAEED
jgi:hypothetical protein